MKCKNCAQLQRPGSQLSTCWPGDPTAWPVKAERQHCFVRSPPEMRRTGTSLSEQSRFKHQLNMENNLSEVKETCTVQEVEKHQQNFFRLISHGVHSPGEQFPPTEPLVMMGNLEECALGNSLIDLEHCYWTSAVEMNCLYNKSTCVQGFWRHELGLHCWTRPCKPNCWGKYWTVGATVQLFGFRILWMFGVMLRLCFLFHFNILFHLVLEKADRELH